MKKLLAIIVIVIIIIVIIALAGKNKDTVPALDDQLSESDTTSTDGSPAGTVEEGTITTDVGADASVGGDAVAPADEPAVQ